MPERTIKSHKPDSDEAHPENNGQVVAIQAGVAHEEPPRRKVEMESYEDKPDKSTGLFGLPKVIVNIGAVGFCLVMLGYVVMDLVKRQGDGAALAERLMDKFDATLEKHDGRQREWMRSHGDLIRVENDKTRAELRENVVRQERFQLDISRLHEQQLQVLKQIRDEKKMP